METMLFFIKHLLSNNSYLFVFIISLLESLVITGLFLPGLILMGSIGILIGNGQLNFYYVWFFSTIGCIIGDIISYYIGLIFEKKINEIQWFKKNDFIINKIKKFLNLNYICTIIFGKFIGPIRPIIPIISGMLKLPIKKFFLYDIIACLLWPVIYMSPGIITSITKKSLHNNTKNNNSFIFLISLFIITIIFFFWFLYKIYNFLIKGIEFKILNFCLSKNKKYIFLLIILIIILLEIIFLNIHPNTIFFKKILYNIIMQKKTI